MRGRGLVGGRVVGGSLGGMGFSGLGVCWGGRGGGFWW